jgi:hypothetical protein
MQAAQHRLREYDEALANTMARLLSRERGSFGRRIGHARPQRHVRTRPVVMPSPIFKDPTQVPFGQRDSPVQTLPSDGADRALADGIGLCPQLHLMVTVRRDDCVLSIPFTRCADVSSRS